MTMATSGAKRELMSLRVTRLLLYVSGYVSTTPVLDSTSESILLLVRA